MKALFSRKTILFSGLCLFLAGILLLTWFFASPYFYEKKAKETLALLQKSIPTPQGAMVEARRDNTMPTLSVKGEDFVGMVEMPAYNFALPVAATWGKTNRCPALFEGSVYDGSLILGGSGLKGQLDFHREISVGDKVFFTDVEGNRFFFAVSDIKIEENAEKETLEKKDADLTLFIQNPFAFEFIILFCQANT